MIKISPLPILIFLFFAVASAFSQEKPVAKLLDEHGQPCSEEFSARFDYLIYELKQDPGAKGYVIFNGNRNTEGRNINFKLAYSDWYPKLRIEPDKIVFLRGEDRDNIEVQLWVVPAGADPPKAKGEYKAPDYEKNTLFDIAWADFHRDDIGRRDIYSDGFITSWGCDFEPNRGMYTRILNEKPNLRGHIIVYTEFGKSRGRGIRLGNAAVSDLVKNYKLPRHRLTMAYGGERKDPEIELWLVPKGNKLPVPTAGKKTD